MSVVERKSVGSQIRWVVDGESQCCGLVVARCVVMTECFCFWLSAAIVHEGMCADAIRMALLCCGRAD